MKFSIKGFFSKCDQTCSFLRIWSHLLKKSLMENFIFCALLITKHLRTWYNFGIFPFYQLKINSNSCKQDNFKRLKPAVVVIIIELLHWAKRELKFCADSNPPCGMLQICDGENPENWSLLKIKLIVFRWLTITQKLSSSSSFQKTNSSRSSL